MKRTLQQNLQRLVSDKGGKVVLGQRPNLPLIIFVIASAGSFLCTKGYLGYTLKALAFGSLFTWAWLEIFFGVNYFRRILGVVVMLLSVLSAIAYLHSFS